MPTLSSSVQAIVNVPSLELVTEASSFGLEFDFPTPVVTEGSTYDSVAMSGLPQYGAPGEPVLPFRIAKVLIPQGKCVQNVDVITSNRIVLEGRFNLEYGKTPIPISSNATIEDLADQTIYDSTNPFPSVLFSRMSEQHLRGYKILMLKLHPVQYIPKRGELYYFKSMNVTISLKETDKTSVLFRNSLQDRELVLGIVDNPDMMETYTERTTTVQPSSLADPSYSYDYVIITNNALSSSFQPLIDWKIHKGLDATIVLVEDIVNDSGYHCDGFFGDGCGTAKFNDTQAHIRNFIKDAYQNWGAKYVLLGGDDEIIPARGVYAYTSGYCLGNNITDYNLPCDMYYGTLDGSWDNDNDTILGEGVYHHAWEGPENGTSGEEADFLAEVYVGRATVDTAKEATIFVNKTLAYEQAHNATYVKEALMIGEKLDDLTEGGNGKDLTTDLIPQYTTTRLYDRDKTFSRDAVIDKVNSGVHIVNHDGHAWHTTVMGLSSSHIDNLNNTEFFLAYSIGCYSAAFDNVTSGSGEAVGEHFVISSGGAFAYIGNSRYGLYLPGSTDGPGERYDRSFFNVLNSGVRNLGKALQLSKENLLGEFFNRWTYFTLNLLGDPEIEIITEIKAPTAHFETRTDLLTPPCYKGSMSINGTAKLSSGSISSFDNYTIEFGVGTNPLSWSSTGINLTNNGKAEVLNSTLAIWDTTLISNGTYTLRLTVSDVDSNVGKDWAVVTIARTQNYYLVTPYSYEGAYVGETFQVSINASVAGHGGHGMFGYAFKFYWNRTLINATGCTVYRPAAWGSSWMDVGSGLLWDYNVTHGRYDTATTALNPAAEVYGNFTLVTIDFEVIHQPVYPEPDGYCLLNLVNTLLSGEAGFVIPHDTYDGEYKIKSVIGIHDVAVIDIHTVYCNDYSVQINKTVVCKNYTTCINVTVTNEGDLTETTDIALWTQGVSAIQIGASIPVTLGSGASKEVTFIFDSASLSKGNYTLFANATTVQGETDTVDNTYVDGWIFVVHPGDLDCDGHVFLYDLTILGTAWDSRLGDSHWCADADIDGDLHVFLGDVNIVGNHWNEVAS
jgi:hypothetical protein